MNRQSLFTPQLPFASSPTIEKITCPWCDGRGLVRPPLTLEDARRGELKALRRCAACAGSGNITVESP